MKEKRKKERKKKERGKTGKEDSSGDQRESLGHLPWTDSAVHCRVKGFERTFPAVCGSAVVDKPMATAEEYKKLGKMEGFQQRAATVSERSGIDLRSVGVEVGEQWGRHTDTHVPSPVNTFLWPKNGHGAFNVRNGLIAVCPQSCEVLMILMDISMAHYFPFQYL